MYGRSFDRNKAIDKGEWSICRVGRLERFYCMRYEVMVDMLGVPDIIVVSGHEGQPLLDVASVELLSLLDKLSRERDISRGRDSWEGKGGRDSDRHRQRHPPPPAGH